MWSRFPQGQAEKVIKDLRTEKSFTISCVAFPLVESAKNNMPQLVY